MPSATAPDPASDGAVPPGPLTPADLRAAGLDRAALARALRAGSVVRVLRGVYAAADAPQDLRLRAGAARLAVGPGWVASGRTAAWVHGADIAAHTRRVLPPGPPVPTCRRPLAALPTDDVVEVAGALVTTPVRTVLDLARGDDAPVALAVADALAASGALPARRLLAVLAGAGLDPAARGVLALVDDRARGPAESVLRLHWHRSPLPTPVPGHAVALRGGGVRLALALPDHRFGVLVAPSTPGQVRVLPGPDDAGAVAARLRDAGWWAVVLPATRVLQVEPGIVRQHLEREFHQALLAQVV